ncbi:MAG: PLxRFG domain-containing protein, partial [Candidatus Polarisedimenticolia bacterium]
HSKLQDWAAETLDGGNELQHRIMERVLVRLDDAGLFEDDADAAAINSELIAYFVEEAVAAGVDPMAMDSGSDLGRWLRQLWAAFKAALRRLRFTNLERLSPSDIVALAAGAARVELAEDGSLSAAQPRPETRETAVSFGVDSRATRDNAGIAKKAIRAMPEAAQGPALLVWETIADAANKGVNALSFTRDLVDRIGDKLPAARRLFEALRAAQADRLQREKAVSDIVSDFDRLPAAIKTAVNAYLRDSTEKQAWGYQPPWRTQSVAIDDAMKARFEALPGAARETIMAVNKHGHDTLREKRTAMNRRIVESFDRRIARDPARAEELEAAKAETLRSAGVFLTELDGPYAPLKRFGKYVVVGMSARYAAELEKVKRTGDTATLDNLKTDGKHYSVHFAESRLEAAKLKDGLIQRGLQADTWQKSKFKQEFAVDMRAFDQLRAAVQSEADGAESKQARQAAAAMEALVDDLILQSLAEHHARQANQQRRGIKGFDQDMMRAFATQGQADAFFLANLDNGREINAALFEMDKQVRTPSAVSREEKANLANHMFDVYTRSATHVDTPIQDNLAMFSSVWFLLLSPAYYMQNAMQPILMTLPYLTKDVSYTSASRALVDGYRAVAPMVRGKVNFESFDIDSLAPDDRSIVQALIGRNIIDVTIETELGGFSHAGSNRAKRAMTALRRLPAKLEMINRVSSALASYKLAREKLGKDHAGALDYAEKVTAVTHGDYSQLNAPTLFTSTPLHKLLFQFRKFQMIQIAYMVRLANQALVGLTPEERAGAVKALSFTLGHQAVLAGAMGFPAVTLASFFVSMMTGGDDEPDSLEKKAREGLLALGFDETARDLIMNGVPGPVFGSTITSKIGMSNMLSLFPFSEWGVGSREGVEGLIAASMGPMASLGMSAADGLGLIGQGELYKGLEKLVPKGLRDVMASARMANEGIVDRRDTTVMQREDLATFDLISNALGLPTKVQTDRWFTQREKFAYETYFNERTAQLKREYVRAFRDGKPRYEIEREWRNLQAAKRRNGFRTQSFSDLRNALRENRERERSTAGGVVYDEGSRKFTERLSTL